MPRSSSQSLHSDDGHEVQLRSGLRTIPCGPKLSKKIDENNNALVIKIPD